MARITVEDCLAHMNNRFELVLAATKRARQIERGAEPFVPWENDKPTVVALREISAELVTAEVLHQEAAAEAAEAYSDVEARRDSARGSR